MASDQSIVSITKLKPNPWNTNLVSPDNEKRIEASISRFAKFGGFFKPITVRTLDDGTLQILGGQHRWEAAGRLKIKEVPIFNVGSIDDKTAQEIGLADNGRYGEDDPLALSALLKGLGTTEELTSFLPYTDLDLANIFSTTSIGLDELGLDHSTDLPGELASKPAPSHQIMRFKIPVEDVARMTARIEEVMRNENFTADDSLTNAGNALVNLIFAPVRKAP